MFHLELHSETLERKFRLIGGQYYFTLRGAEWMLPVSEDEYLKARDLSAVIARVSLILTWVVNLGAVGFGAYLVLFLNRPFVQALYAWLAGFALCVLINLYPQTLPTMGMWRRLRHAQQLDDETKAKVLARRTELI